MKLVRTRTGIGVAILAAVSSAAWGLSATQASATAASAVNASSALSHRLQPSHGSKGRGSDGHGGEHSGGAVSWRHSVKGKTTVKKQKPRGGGGSSAGNHGGGSTGGGNHGGGNNGGGNTNGGGNHGGGHHGCHYPPSRTHHVEFGGPTKTRRGVPVTLSGKVSHNGCQLAGVKVGLYSSHNGRTGWVLIAKTTTDSRGAFSFRVPGLATHYYQSVAAAGRGTDAVASRIHVVHVR